MFKKMLSQTWLKISLSDLDHQIRSLLKKWFDLKIFAHNATDLFALNLDHLLILRPHFRRILPWLGSNYRFSLSVSWVHFQSILPNSGFYPQMMLIIHENFSSIATLFDSWESAPSVWLKRTVKKRVALSFI